MNTYEQQAKKKLAAIIMSVFLIAAVIVGLDQFRGKSVASTAAITTPSATPESSPSATAAPAGAPATLAPTPTPAPSSGYRDGSYSATASYYVPHSTEAIKVTLTLKDGVVSAVSIANSESDPESARYQEDFAAEYHSYVVGQSLSDLRLVNVAGASDTTDGFNQAIAQIAQQARA